MSSMSKARSVLGEQVVVPQWSAIAVRGIARLPSAKVSIPADARVTNVLIPGIISVAFFIWFPIVRYLLNSINFDFIVT